MPARVEAAMRDVERRLVDPRDGHDAGLQERMAHHGVPGIGLALIADGEIAWERGYGVRDAEHPGPVAPTTRFQACSISKPIAVLAMLRLVESGVLELDADVNDVLRSWRVPPNASWQPRVTLRQIASHSAGLTVSGFPGYRAGAPLPTLTEILTGSSPANTPSVRVDTLPGVEFRYAGGGTAVLQQVLEDVTGRPFAELVRELVLGPLGMERSDYVQPLPPELHDEAATAHRSDGSPVAGRWHTYPELAAAGLWTTPGDLARYGIGVQRAADGAPGAILASELAGTMLTPHVASTERLGGLDSVGLGLFLARPEAAWFGHSGGNEGFRCHLVAHRHAGCGAVVMTNGDRGHSLIAEILNAIARGMEWPAYVPAQIEDSGPGQPLEAFTGVYELRPGTTIEVSGHGDDLVVAALGQPPLRFLRVSETTFASFAVETTLEPAPPELILRQNGGEHRCRRLA